ncbi:Gfo/Idh/MocA family protein [Paludisphaera mucosa]|uniref:Gfo/Idh/MocA family oxidoreductase n=1 Tax=Paludisphaera mucosa TaxID=3030827 RepID=A0ABT6FHL8_9BACT|nr:Gfo/Idh/MocA family oxidoreductase [Paludisphaera mucosa]MDG3007040.1 Gfo/Idh/MocA family oxidoreductase [Paludisphaera mucosa]
MTNRRDALKIGAAGLTTSMLGGYTRGAADEKTRRVGLIGCGWYGKSDLFRLNQVAPIEVVSLCDPDKNQVAHAAEMVAQRQPSKKTPRTYGDYREMLKEKDLDIVLVATPDHWHALAMIAAVESGADVYVQKPISHDVLEGEAMVAAARKHNRVVQVGTQRKSTPHLIEAKKQVVDAGLLGKVGHVEVCCYYHMRANGDPPVTAVPDFFDYEMWTGPAPLRPYDGLPHVRWWRTFNEYGSGITGDMCVHMLDTARWMLGLGWPQKISSTGGILVQKAGKSNITDTQAATFEYPEFDVVWQHRTWGTSPDADYPWALMIYGEKGTLKASTMRADFIPQGEGKPLHFECVFEREKYPEDVSEPEIELNAAPATRLHMRNFLASIADRSRPIADIEQGHISTSSCLLANLAMQLKRPVVYDPAKRIVVGDDEATRLLKGPYRAPWTHPADALG